MFSLLPLYIKKPNRPRIPTLEKFLSLGPDEMWQDLVRISVFLLSALCALCGQERGQDGDRGDKVAGRAPERWQSGVCHEQQVWVSVKESEQMQGK